MENKPELLTPQEAEIIENLSNAIQLFRALPVQHPLENYGFMQAVHEAEQYVWGRPVQRQHDLLKQVEKQSDG